MLLRKAGSALFVVFLLSGTLASGIADAATLSCGAVIVEDTTLDGDIGPCPGDGIVIGTVGVVLDLGGHTVWGSGSGTGIWVGGPNHVRNGTVTGFNTGLELRSFNRVERVVVAANRCHGLSMQFGADGNRVSDSVARGNGCDGIHIHRSRDNSITATAVIGNAASGVTIESFGGLVTRATGNRVSGSSISGNGGDGVLVDWRSGGTRIENNAIAGNTGNGVEVGGSYNGTDVTGNWIHGNRLNGVLVHYQPSMFPSVVPNEVVGNVAQNNGTTPASFDLADLAPGCAGTTWVGNQFLTRNQPCIS